MTMAQVLVRLDFIPGMPAWKWDRQAPPEAGRAAQQPLAPSGPQRLLRVGHWPGDGFDLTFATPNQTHHPNCPHPCLPPLLTTQEFFPHVNVQEPGLPITSDSVLSGPPTAPRQSLRTRKAKQHRPQDLPVLVAWMQGLSRGAARHL